MTPHRQGPLIIGLARRLRSCRRSCASLVVRGAAVGAVAAGHGVMFVILFTNYMITDPATTPTRCAGASRHSGARPRRSTACWSRSTSCSDSSSRWRSCARSVAALSPSMRCGPRPCAASSRRGWRAWLAPRAPVPRDGRRAAMSVSAPIAIVGMACRYPDARLARRAVGERAAPAAGVSAAPARAPARRGLRRRSTETPSTGRTRRRRRCSTDGSSTGRGSASPGARTARPT